MIEVCSYYHIQKWKRKPKGICCALGKVNLPPIQKPPVLFDVMLNGDHQNSRILIGFPGFKDFINNLKANNRAFLNDFVWSKS